MPCTYFETPQERAQSQKDAEKLALVWKADPKRGLEAQLGFDPDSY